MRTNGPLFPQYVRVLHDSIYVPFRPLKVVTDCFVYDILTEAAAKSNAVTDGLLPIVDLNRSSFLFPANRSFLLAGNTTCSSSHRLPLGFIPGSHSRRTSAYEPSARTRQEL